MSNMQLSKNFSSDEFKCKCGKCEQVLPPIELIDVLQDVRDHFGKPVRINSGYRCPEYNESVGGAIMSRHKNAEAGDITVEDISPNEVHEYLCNKYPTRYGIGSYPYFTHIDVRPYKARW